MFCHHSDKMFICRYFIRTIGKYINININVNHSQEDYNYVEDVINASVIMPNTLPVFELKSYELEKRQIVTIN